MCAALRRQGEFSMNRIDPKRTALVSMDMQAGIVALYVKDETFIPRVSALLQSARAAELLIVHVKVGFRENVPEASSRNRFLSTVKASPQHQQFFQGASGAIHPALTPAENEVVVTKNRISAFAGTDLDLLLRAHDVETLVMFGIATSGVVLGSFQSAVDVDYETVVISDCCADLDMELHQLLLDKHFPRFGTVTTAAEIEKMLEASSLVQR
jgi:nicotinamidase-related amidase